MAILSICKVGSPIFADQIRVASNPWTQLKGLIGTKYLSTGEGLWFPGTNSIHMWFMSIPIDALFLSKPDQNGYRRVVGLRHHMRPWRNIVWLVRGANGCLELPAGILAQAGLQKGDLVNLTEV
jgi:uncharacterized membrane protein (UPF0127 family)